MSAFVTLSIRILGHAGPAHSGRFSWPHAEPYENYVIAKSKFHDLSCKAERVSSFALIDRLVLESLA